MSELQADYDNPWKDAIEFYFEDFLTFFFRDVHSLIDWNRTPIPLDKELQQIVKEAESGKGFTDKLFQVWLLDGAEAWVMVHIEVQSQVDSDFPQRMYRYNYRLFDRYERPVISLAVLGDEQINWRPSSYSYDLGGCRVSLEFPTVKLLDYQTQWQQLEQNLNPFAFMVMAHLKTKATTKDYQARQQWKWRLIRALYERGYNRGEIIQLFRLIDWMMTLPTDLQNQLEIRLTRYQEERKMPVLSNIEVRALARGEQKGKLLNARESVLEVLEARFGEVSLEIREAVNQIEDVSRLKQLVRQASVIPSLVEFQQLLVEHESS